MSYIKINGDDTKYYVSLMPFTTQHGIDAIRFRNENIPETDKGFKVYDDNDNIISDLSDYIYPYRPNEFSVEEDVIDTPVWTNDPVPSATDGLSARVSQLSAQVQKITPYEETKTAYYGESEKNFYNVPQGNVTIFFDKYEGEYDVNRVGTRLTVIFPKKLTEATNVTLMVQN